MWFKMRKLMNIPYEDIDPKCKDMVKLFNNVGLITEFSCQGHDNTYSNSFQIMFSDFVNDKDINNFLSNFDEHPTHTPIIGCFKKWARKHQGSIKSNWEYIVNYGDYKLNQEFALEDYKIMKKFFEE